MKVNIDAASIYCNETKFEDLERKYPFLKDYNLRKENDKCFIDIDSFENIYQILEILENNYHIMSGIVMSRPYEKEEKDYQLELLIYDDYIEYKRRNIYKI